MSENKVIDFSQYAKPTLTEEDLRAKATGGVKFKDGAWYRFRTVSVLAGVSKPVIRDGQMPKGSMWIKETLHAVNAAGNLSTKTKDTDNYTTLWARTNPKLLADLGYTPEMIEFVSKRGAPNVFSMVSQRLWAFDTETYGNTKDPQTGKWAKDFKEVEAIVKEGQYALWLDPTPLKGSEAFYRVSIEVQNGFARVNLNSPRPISLPPAAQDGSPEEVLDPDA
jgi:hypothetical protein